MTTLEARKDIDWAEIRRRYEQEPCSIRALSREFGTTDTRIHRHARANGWKLYTASQRGLQRKTEAAQLPNSNDQTRIAAFNADDSLGDPTIPHPSEIARESCGTINALRANLDIVVRNLHLIRELADAETASDKNPARARLVEKVLSLPGLIKAANDLTSAIARLADLGPGKKANALDLAKTADSGLFATPPAPNRETLQ
jgi:hypothetical protein